MNPVHEAKVEAFLRRRRPDLSVIGSHRVCREWREYERTSTAVLSAYVHPLAKTYLRSLSAELEARNVGSELLVHAVERRRRDDSGSFEQPPSRWWSPVRQAVSWAPRNSAGGSASRTCSPWTSGARRPRRALISDGKVRVSSDYRIEWDRTSPGYPIRIPVVDLVEIGKRRRDRSPGSTMAAVFTSGRSARAPFPVRRPTARAARRRPRPTPTCCSGGSIPISSWAAPGDRTCGRWRGRSRAWANGWAAT